jgi:uncharacterized protein (TIGR02246 family)
MLDFRSRTLEVNDATYAAWKTHDADAVSAVFAEDAVIREVGGAGESRGRAAIRDRAAALMAAFPDMHLERVELVIDGDRHADRWVLTGTIVASCSASRRPVDAFASRAPLSADWARTDW